MKINFFFLFNLVMANVFAQAPNWHWAKKANTSFASSITANSGNAFVVGSFSGSSITFDSTTLTSGGSDDMLIVKYDINGNILWAKSAGGSASDWANSVSIDASGNLLVTGYFTSPTIVFGSTTLINSNNIGFYPDMFLVKYNAFGNVLWATSAGGNKDDIGTSVATDVAENVFVSGLYYSTSIVFGSTTLTNSSAGIGAPDIFLVKYDATGNVLWAKSSSGSMDDGATSVTTDASGNAFITGYFSSPSLVFGSTTITNAGGNDVFLVKYDAAGNVLWANSAGGTSSDGGISITNDASGNVFVTGYFNSPAVFGSTNLTNVGSNNLFIVKYNSAGNVLWAKSVSTSDANSVKADAVGNVFLAGSFKNASIDFGAVSLTNTNTNYYDLFLAKYDAAGNVLWAKNAGGVGNDYANSISVDLSGNIFVAGTFQSSSVIFGPTTLTSTGGGNMYISKLETLTGIYSFENGDGISIYPNPFTVSTTIELNSELINSSLTIYNIFGQIIKKIVIPGTTTNVSREGFPAGIYFIQLTKDHKTIATKKLVITDTE